MKLAAVLAILVLSGCSTLGEETVTEEASIHRFLIEESSAEITVICESGEMNGCGVTLPGEEAYWYRVGVGGAPWEVAPDLEACPATGAVKVVVWCSEPTRARLLAIGGAPRVTTSTCERPDC